MLRRSISPTFHVIAGSGWRSASREAESVTRFPRLGAVSARHRTARCVRGRSAWATACDATIATFATPVAARAKCIDASPGALPAQRESTSLLAENAAGELYRA